MDRFWRGNLPPSYSACGQVEPAGTQQVSRMGQNPARRRNLVNNSPVQVVDGSNKGAAPTCSVWAETPSVAGRSEAPV